MKRNISHLRSALTAEERYSPEPEQIKAALQPAAGAARDHKKRRRLFPIKPLLAAAAVIIIAAGATTAIVSNRTNSNDSSDLEVAATNIVPLTSGQTTEQTATRSSAPAATGEADTPIPDVPPVPTTGPLAMVPGTPGVNGDNQSLQPKPAAGGRLSIALRNGCAYLDLPGASDNKDPVAVFDSGSTVLNGSRISYWGLEVDFDETVSIGYGELTLSQIRSEYDTLYLPEACSRTGAFAVLNTINSE